jgi:hypothetical protein
MKNDSKNLSDHTPIINTPSTSGIKLLWQKYLFIATPIINNPERRSPLLLVPSQ